MVKVYGITRMEQVSLLQATGTKISALIETISSDEYLNDIEIVDKNGSISDDTSIEMAFNSMPKDDFADTDFFAKVTHGNGYNSENFDIFIQVYK